MMQPQLQIATKLPTVLVYLLLLASVDCRNVKRSSTGAEQKTPALDKWAADLKPSARLSADDEYLVGVGIADITGPAAGINLMGYAKPGQDSSGIHLRQFSRSVIIEDSHGGRILYTSLDNGMVSQLLMGEVLKRLAKTYGEHHFNASNFMMTSTHSHSCPGGFFQYMLYNIPSAGFIGQTLEALVTGIERSVARAHDNIRPARIYLNQGELLDASINRSPASYQNNPAAERQKYQHDTDKVMHLLKVMDSESGEPMAVISWFPVHGTSMNSSNHLISSDNKGYASILFEKEFSKANTRPGKGNFVAIFAQANEGDVSPNTNGPKCSLSGLPCDLVHSTCAAKHDKCIAAGPGKDMFDSTRIIAHKQYQKARQLFLEAREPVRGPVRFAHEYIDMTRQVVPVYKSALDVEHLRAQATTSQLQARSKGPTASQNASAYTTCPAALGYSFAAGTTDGPGSEDFYQAETVSTRYWNLLRDFLRKPSDQQILCHKPKPIFLSTGEMDFPYMWHPKIIPTQIIAVGQVAIVGLPAEFTTMAGRRVREAVQRALGEPARPRQAQLGEQFGSKSEAASVNRERVKRELGEQRSSEWNVFLSGLSNVYSSYVTTIEEYEVQRYEAGSTLYGPHTLQAYVNQFSRLARVMRGEEPVARDQPQPPDLTKSLFTLRTGVLFDSSPHGKSFGDLVVDVKSAREAHYQCGDLVRAIFVAGNPRNDLRLEESFLYVEKYQGNGVWQVVATDADWETKFIWERTSTVKGESQAIMEWEIPALCEAGFYRMLHVGAHKNLFQNITPYSGRSSPFKIVSAANESLVEEPLMWQEAAGAIKREQSEQAQQPDQTSRQRDNATPVYRKGFALLTRFFRAIV